MKTLKKGAALACAATIAGGALFVAAPASAETSEDWASDSFAVEAAQNVWYTTADSTSSAQELPVRITDTITATSVADLFAEGSSLTSTLSLPENVYTTPGNRNEAPANSTLGTARVSVTSGAVGVEGSELGSAFQFTVTPVEADEVALSAESATITTNATPQLRFTEPGTYTIGDETIEVREYAPSVEPGGGASETHDGYWSIRRHVNPATGATWGAEPDIHITVVDAAGDAPVYATYYLANGESRPVDLAEYDSGDSEIPIDAAVFLDEDGNYVPGVLEVEYANTGGENAPAYNIQTRLNTPSFNTSELVLTPAAENPDAIVVTPTAPTVNLEGATCDAPGNVVYPEIEGVEYGARGGDQYSVIIAATPVEGYVFPEGATTTWHLLLVPEECINQPEQPAGPSLNVPATVPAAELLEGVEFPFVNFPANAEITFELWTGDTLLSSSVITSDENGEGVLVAQAYLETSAGRIPVENGTEFRVVASADGGFETIVKTFVATADATTPTTPGAGGSTDATPSGELATTGADLSVPVIAGGIVLLLAGGVALFVARRRAATA